MDLVSFESLALPALDLKVSHSANPVADMGGAGGGASGENTGTRKKLLVVDEVGKMELFSRDFVERVRVLFESGGHTSFLGGCGHVGVVLMATIPVHRPRSKSHWLLEAIRQRQDCKLYQVIHSTLVLLTCTDHFSVV